MSVGGGDLGDLSLTALFKAELENHSVLLNEGFLDLENDLASAAKIEPIMRAAHSIKGAARIVGLDELGRLAHAMEDALVAAQEGKIALHENHLDVFFKTADVFSGLAQMAEDELAAWPTQHLAEIEALVASLEDVRAGKVPASQSPPAPPSPPAAEPPAKELLAPLAAPATPDAAAPPGSETPSAPAAPPVEKPSSAADRKDSSAGSQSRTSAVRVSSENINRLMGLAAESIVESKRLPPFTDALLRLKRSQLLLVDTLDKLEQEVSPLPAADRLEEMLQTARRQGGETVDALSRHMDQFDSYTRKSTLVSERLYHEVIGTRMRPFADGAPGFPRMVRDISRSLGKKVRFEIEGKAVPVDRDILEKLEAPLNHILRNALDHGIETPAERQAAGKPETALVRVQVRHRAGMLLVEVQDDGRGIDLERLAARVIEKGLSDPVTVPKLSEPELLEFLFLPGFSTASAVTDVSGRGVGLDVVRSMLHEVAGSVRVNTRLGEGTTFQLQLPVTRSVLRTLLVDIGGEPYAFPLSRVGRCLKVPFEQIQTIENRQFFRHEGENIGLVTAREVLEVGDGDLSEGDLCVLVVGDKGRSYGLEVDRFAGESDLVVRPLDPRLGKVANIQAAAMLEDGAPVLIVDVEDLIQSIDGLLSGGRIGKARRRQAKAGPVQHKTVLVVDDSITVRETERKLLQNRGYAVDVAVDGVDGWNAVRLGNYDLVISDVDMPRMTGIDLVRQIKQHPRLKSLPVMIVSYKDREEDRLRGLDAGANYYLTKSSFHDEALLDAVADLIGEVEE